MIPVWIINIVAGFFKVSQPELAKLENALPATKKLIDLFNKHQDLIERVQAFQKEITPLVDEAMKEWKTVGPALALVIDILERNTKKGVPVNKSIEHIKMTLFPHP